LRVESCGFEADGSDKGVENDVDVLRRALMRDSNGKAEGPLGRLFDLLAADA
jgi:hypothetical protein